MIEGVFHSVAFCVLDALLGVEGVKTSLICRMGNEEHSLHAMEGCMLYY